MDPDAPVGLFTRLWDWLTYRPWTDEELAEQVAKSVANTCYKPWHDQLMYVEIPMLGWPSGPHSRDAIPYSVYKGEQETP